MGLIYFFSGAGISWLSIGVGVLWHRSRIRNSKPEKIQPICGCGHHHSFHDPDTGNCHSLIKGNPIKYDAYREPTAWDKVQCPCRKYSGPEPLPSFYAGEISE